MADYRLFLLQKDDLAKLARFVHKHQPHVIAVAGENLQARFVK